MTDPFYMIMLMHALGPDYIVWDQVAQIEYIAPGKATVHARFRITDEMLDEVRQHTAGGEKYLPRFVIEVTGPSGALVARITRTLYVRLKSRARPALLQKDDA